MFCNYTMPNVGLGTEKSLTTSDYWISFFYLQQTRFLWYTILHEGIIIPYYVKLLVK